MSGEAEPAPALAVVDTMDVAVLSKYLQRICPPLLDVEDDQFERACTLPTNNKSLSEFITDNRNPVLIVKKIIQVEDEG